MIKWRLDKNVNWYFMNGIDRKLIPIDCAVTIVPCINDGVFTVYVNFLQKNKSISTIKNFKSLDLAKAWAEREVKNRAKKAISALKKTFSI